MATLILHVNSKIWHLIYNGKKKVEYRDYKTYYITRLQKKFDVLEIHLGYPKAGLCKIMMFKFSFWLDEIAMENLLAEENEILKLDAEANRLLFCFDVSNKSFLGLK